MSPRADAPAGRHRILHAALPAAAVLALAWGFVALAAIGEGGASGADAALLRWAQSLHAPGLDRFFLLVSALGYAWGVIPLDAAIALLLLWLRRWRAFGFFAAAVVGSALLNVGAKAFYRRERPQVWQPLAGEDSFSFPSAHAMGSMTLAAAAVVLLWPTRWRWPALLALVPFVALVGFSRVYLGVHLPSEVLAGWAAALGCVIAAHLLLYRVTARG